jgi:hypothetical protein
MPTVTLRHGPCDGLIAEVGPAQRRLYRPTAPDWRYDEPMVHAYEGTPGATDYYYAGIEPVRRLDDERQAA